MAAACTARRPGPAAPPPPRAHPGLPHPSGDKVLAFRYGQFSHLWIDMMTRLGLDVTVIECPWGEGAHEGRLAEALAQDAGKQFKAVCVVHNETTTGVTSDIGAVRQVGRRQGWARAGGGAPGQARRAGRTPALSPPHTPPSHPSQTLDAAGHPALLLVDGVSSIGALDFQFDAWRVDVAVTGSQKALSLPTGLAVIAVSEKVRGVTRAAGGGGAGRARAPALPRAPVATPHSPDPPTPAPAFLLRPWPPASPPSCPAATTTGMTSWPPTPRAGKTLGVGGTRWVVRRCALPRPAAAAAARAAA